MTSVAANGMKLVETCSGIGRLEVRGREFDEIPYEIVRYQGLARSGLPIPGIHRIQGKLDLSGAPAATDGVGVDSTLTLEDGRQIRVAIASAEGDVFSEGHGPSKCTCC